MRRLALFLSLILLGVTVSPSPVLGQKPKDCEFSLVGTWKALRGADETTLWYRFVSDGTVTVLESADPGNLAGAREIARATYTLDNPKSPKRVSVKSGKAIGILSAGANSIEILDYDDITFNSTGPGEGSTRWVRIDPSRYYMVFAGRRGVFYDGGGPAFPMLISTDGRQTQIDAVGIYSLRGLANFGAIPAETYNQFMKEPRDDADVLLRLEITGGQYERSLKILKTWDRRTRNNELLYVDVHLNNALLLKQVSESLNHCKETVNLYRLDWGVDDYISDRNPTAQAPFLFFKEMRRRNESLHVRDDKFLQQTPLLARPANGTH